MSELLPAAASVSEAWLLSVERTVATGRRAVHVVSTVTQPGLEIASIRASIDQSLAAAGEQSVQTVAETIFPVSLYSNPGYAWTPDLATEQVERLDAAADFLYSAYSDMLPLLLTVQSNNRGTYFSRMISWPGKTAGGINQLARRIDRLRGEYRAGRRTHNALDMDLAADALAEDAPDDEDLAGVQIYAATDKRTRAFPCLTHIDLTLHQGRLHMTAVYRHQYLIQKAYGNLLGLSWLMYFICQQTGSELGELVVHATLADAENRPRAEQLSQAARSTLDQEGLAILGLPA